MNTPARRTARARYSPGFPGKIARKAPIRLFAFLFRIKMQKIVDHVKDNEAGREQKPIQTKTGINSVWLMTVVFANPTNSYCFLSEFCLN
jgi:hypothetical protein